MLLGYRHLLVVLFVVVVAPVVPRRQPVALAFVVALVVHLVARLSFAVAGLVAVVLLVVGLAAAAVAQLVERVGLAVAAAVVVAAALVVELEGHRIVVGVVPDIVDAVAWDHPAAAAAVPGGKVDRHLAVAWVGHDFDTALDVHHDSVEDLAWGDHLLVVFDIARDASVDDEDVAEYIVEVLPEVARPAAAAAAVDLDSCSGCTAVVVPGSSFNNFFAVGRDKCFFFMEE